MLLHAPDASPDVLWEGPLEPETDEAVEPIQRDQAARDLLTNFRDDIHNLPTISIGRPEVWHLSEVYPPDKMSTLLRSKTEQADFYLVRTTCTFRPSVHRVRLSWARFLVRLLPDTSGRQPRVYDLHPKEVYQEVQHQVKVALSPSLSFQQVEAGLGGLEFGLEYPELQPIISAGGLGEDVADWNYEEAKGIVLQGSKTMHLLVTAPKGMPAASATLGLVADVEVGGFSVPVIPSLLRRSEQQEADPMRVQLW
jgi:hypothetical protein